jgi:diaminopimelate epimerase
MLVEVDFVKISPTQNMTVLVTSAVERRRHTAVAAKIMAYDSVYAEQVGFLEKPSDPAAAARLQMAGGEFCGNAALSLCAYLVWSGKVACDDADNADAVRVPIEVSGSDDILHCRIKREHNHFLGTIKMPLPLAIESFNAEIAGQSRVLPVVHFPGITHVIVDGEHGDKIAIAETLAENSSLFTNTDAFGIMFYDENPSEKSGLFLTPFVCVKTLGTKVWERGCGSGSAALGAYLAHNRGENIKMDVMQSGGTITVEVAFADGAISGISIEGKIEITSYGKALLEL